MSAYLNKQREWRSVAAGEVGVGVGMGVGVGVRDSAAPVLAGQSSTFQSCTGHHVALGMPTLCKAASPRNKGTCLSPFIAKGRTQLCSL